MTTPSNPDTAAEFAAFQAWRASQAGQVPTPPKDETPDVTIADVLKALVRSARFPDESTVNQYCSVIDAAYAPTTGAADGTEA